MSNSQKFSLQIVPEKIGQNRIDVGKLGLSRELVHAPISSIKAFPNTAIGNDFVGIARTSFENLIYDRYALPLERHPTTRFFDENHKIGRTSLQSRLPIPQPQINPELGIYNVSRSLSEDLYESRADFKIRWSKVAMHLPKDWRELLFSRIDRLLADKNWEPDETPVKAFSNATAIRILVYVQPKQAPYLAATPDGHLILAWFKAKFRFSVECLKDDRVIWHSTRPTSESKVETFKSDDGAQFDFASGTASTLSLPKIMGLFGTNIL